MNKPTKILLAILSLAFVLGFLVNGLIHWKYDAKPEVFNWLGLNPTNKYKGKEAPNFKLVELHTNKVVTLKQHRGKVVVLDFWASWCGGCQKQLAVLQRIHKDPIMSKKVTILSINMKETAPPKYVKKFLKARGFTFPVLLATKKVVQDYKIWFFPAMVVISPKGKVIYSGAEYHTEPKVRRILRKAAKL